MIVAKGFPDMALKSYYLLVATLLVGLLITGVSRIQAQGNESLPPPRVIDIWPLPGVELSADEPLTVTFDQPMDRGSVEAAFTFEPALSGSFTWADDRTVNFVPGGGWPRAQVYSASVGASAASSDGLTLTDPVSFEVRTIGALIVTGVMPEAGAEGVAADARIVVTFNRPVVPLVSTADLAGLSSPIVIEPAVAGQGEWLNTSIYQFTPSESLRGGTTYTVTVSAGLTTALGAVLETDFRWSFRTLPPQILSISPSSGEQGVRLDRQMVITFSQPMDRASTEAAFSLLYGGEPVQGTFVWADGDTRLTFAPTGTLRIESSYVLNLASSARNATGEATLDGGQSVPFSTVPHPGIERTSPSNGESGVRPGRGASITFRSPMNAETFADRVIIQPETEWTPSVWDDRSLGLQFYALPDTRYSITFLAGAEDIYGNPITTDYTFTYTTGELPSRAYPVTSNTSLSLIGAYRTDSRIPVYVSGTPTVGFELYRVNETLFPAAIQGYYWDQIPFWVGPNDLVRQWTETLDSGGRDGVTREVLLASEQGGQLPRGFYWIVMRAPDQQLYQFPLAVVSANITVKRTPDEMLVWVTDMPSAQPVVEASVTIYQRNQAIARGSTGADGMFRAPVALPYDDQFTYVVVEGVGVYGLWYSSSAANLPGQQGYLYTDRPIYRPGETVYFRGVLRDRNDMDYRVPNMRTVRVTINSSATGQRLIEEDMALTDFGTFSGELLLPEDAPLGDAYIMADDAYVSFTIAEFRVPEFEVTVTPEQDEIFQGRDLNALVQSSYYFGGPVNDARLSWSAWGEPAYFQYTGPGRYSFRNENSEYFYQYIGDGSATTDANGRFMITTANTRAPMLSPMQITVETTVTDESQQAISGRSTVLAHPANVYVGLRTDRYFGQEGKPMEISLIAVDTQSAPLSEKRIDLTVIEIRWSRVPIEGEFGRYTWSREEIPVETAQVFAGADGTATYTFTPPNAGIFRVEAQALDEYERSNTSTLRFWVTGSRPVWWGEPSQIIDLIADQDSYNVGDTAQILIPIPFAAASTVLVSVERAGVMSYEVLSVEGSTLLYELPITEAHVPTAYVDVTVVKGIDGESLNPDYRTGSIAVNVAPAAHTLTVTVTPTARLAQPRQNVAFDVQAVDANGEPVQAEFGVALTDKAILSLMPPNSGTMVDTFYGMQGDYVYTDISLTGLLDRITDQAVEVQRAMFGATAELDGMMGGMTVPTLTAAVPAPMEEAKGGPAAQSVVVRENFEQTPLWEAHVITDATGHATVSLNLPDNLTTWTLDARGLTADTRVGQTTTEIVATLPLLIRPVAPRFFVVDDRVQLAAVVNNNTEQSQEVAVTLEFDGVTLDSPATQTVTIEPASRGRVEWWATVQDVRYVDLTFIAIGQDGYQDATKPTLASGPDNTIPVYRYTAPDTVGTGGMLAEGGSVTETISLPSRFDDTRGNLTVHVDPSLAATTTSAFTFLRNYPHQCIEQTVSRFLPNVYTYSALRDLGLQDPVLEANLHTAVEEAVQKLALAQNPDGGWGWFSRMESDPLVTAYAALGLIEARGTGFGVEQTIIDRALNFVRADLIRPVVDTSSWRLNRQAFYFYVLAQGGQGNPDEYMALYEYRLKMSYMGRAYLLMAFQKTAPGHSAIADLASDLVTGAILSATGAHWEEGSRDWWNWASDTRTTAVVLDALIQARPESELLPNVVRWLMVARQGDHWETTQENVWAIIALTDWMVRTGELQGQYDYSVSLNRSSLAQAIVTPETVRDGQAVQVAVQDLLRDEVNRLVIARSEGKGALYYTTHLNLRLPAAETPALSRGITVSREYFAADDPDTRIDTAAIGDIITVRVTITAPQDIYFFVLEDPIPAGTEGVDTSLLTTSQQVAGPNLQPQWDNRPYYWFWGWWWFDHTEMRDEQVNLYADYLPAGTYVYTYQVRASIVGEFQTMPSHAYAFYFPEVFGRSEGSLFTVQPAES